MGNKIIAISREFGSGGRTIGKKVAAKLGIPFYDTEIIERIAAESGFSKEFVKEQGEYTTSSSWFINALARDNQYGPTVQDKLWLIQRNIIVEFAEKESCVIVGRCADYILRDNPDCIKVFIHADMEKRAERIVKVYGEKEDAPEKRLREKDKRRKAYYQLYTDTQWGLTKNYDITLNSGTLGIDRCVDIITDVYKEW